MKIRKSIESLIKRQEEKKKRSNTLRQDVVRRALEAGEFERIECDYSYTDDYGYDYATNYGRGEASAKGLLEKYQYLKPSCWLSSRKTINGKECYSITINFHSNLSYSMYVPVS